MAVSAREQRILILAGLVGAVFVVTQIVPAVQGLYQRRNAEIETDAGHDAFLLDNSQYTRLFSGWMGQVAV